MKSSLDTIDVTVVDKDYYPSNPKSLLYLPFWVLQKFGCDSDGDMVSLVLKETRRGVDIKIVRRPLVGKKRKRFLFF